MGRMSPEEVQRFLTTRGSCMFACLEPDGGPYVVPMGYIYAAEWFYFRGRERAAWALYLPEDSRASLCAADDEGRRVRVKGNAELLEEPVVLR